MLRSLNCTSFRAVNINQDQGVLLLLDLFRHVPLGVDLNDWWESNPRRRVINSLAMPSAFNRFHEKRKPCALVIEDVFTKKTYQDRVDLVRHIDVPNLLLYPFSICKGGRTRTCASCAHQPTVLHPQKAPNHHGKGLTFQPIMPLWHDLY